ncbi:hypothetical protein MIMGU_mgv1a0218931mg, partial [Erythranthe guttata]
DILRTVRQMPQAYSVSEDKIKKVKEVVLSTGKYDASCFVRNPKLLMHSIEKRYKPRFEVLGILESRGVIKKWPCLTILSKMTDDTFFNEFVAPYTNEVGSQLEHSVNGWFVALIGAIWKLESGRQRYFLDACGYLVFLFRANYGHPPEVWSNYGKTLLFGQFQPLPPFKYVYIKF